MIEMIEMIEIIEMIEMVEMIEMIEMIEMSGVPVPAGRGTHRGHFCTAAKPNRPTVMTRTEC